MKDLNQGDPEYIKAMTEYMVGNWESAESAFLQLRERYPKSSFIPLSIGEIQYAKGQLKKAVDWYLRALEIEPEWSNAWFKLGESYFRMGQLGKSLEAFNKVLESKDEGHAMASYFVGLINFFLGKDEESDVAFSKFRGVAPESMIANFFLAQLKLKNNEFIEAAELLEELLQEAPSFSEGHFMLGQAYCGLYKNADAIRTFRRVLELNPEDNRARNKLTLMTDSEW